jgi:hypothetical protein
MVLADKVLEFLKSQEPKREDGLYLFSPDQIRKAIDHVIKTFEVFK